MNGEEALIPMGIKATTARPHKATDVANQTKAIMVRRTYLLYPTTNLC